MKKRETLGVDNNCTKAVTLKKTFLGVGVGVACIAAIILAVTLGMSAMSGQASQDENAERQIQEQKLALTEMYADSGISLADSDFIVTEDQDGNVTVDVKDDKKAMLENAKNSFFQGLAPVEPLDFTGGEDTQEAQDENEENGETVADDGINVIDEASLAAKVNSELETMASWITYNSTLGEGDRQEDYTDSEGVRHIQMPVPCDYFNDLMGKIHSGDMSSTIMGTQSVTAQTASNALRAYLYSYVIPSKATTDEWDCQWAAHSYSDGSTTVYGSIIANSTYDTFRVSSFDAVSECQDGTTFYVSGDEVACFYVAYANGKKICLDGNFSILDIS